jgi:hypothetical protein
MRAYARPGHAALVTSSGDVDIQGECELHQSVCMCARGRLYSGSPSVWVCVL